MKTRFLLLGAATLTLLASPALAATGSTAAPAAHPMGTPAAQSAASTGAARTQPTAARAQEGRYAGLYRRAQEKLKSMGDYSGPIDGVRNTAYVTALEHFQTAHHIRATGRLTHETVRALGI